MTTFRLYPTRAPMTGTIASYYVLHVTHLSKPLQTEKKQQPTNESIPSMSHPRPNSEGAAASEAGGNSMGPSSGERAIIEEILMILQASVSIDEMMGYENNRTPGVKYAHDLLASSYGLKENYGGVDD